MNTICYIHFVHNFRIYGGEPIASPKTTTMAFSKAHLFQKSVSYHSMLFKSLAHPARIMILKSLLADKKVKEKTVSQIAAEMPISTKSVSQHLKLLREMHILTFRQEYPNVYYSVNRDMKKTYRNLLTLVSAIDENKKIADSDTEFKKVSQRFANPE